MRCFNCGEFCLIGFCDACEQELGEFSLGVRELASDFKVYSFYKYDEIKHLLFSKHHFYGLFVFNMLAKLSFGKFEQFFSPDLETKISAIALDDRVENHLYSHCAILTKHLKSRAIKPVFAALRAQNLIKYSGKSLSFRQKNKRKFKLLKPINSPVILVDDVITSGLSMLEAKKVLENHQIKVLFGLVLADAKN